MSLVWKAVWNALQKPCKLLWDLSATILTNMSSQLELHGSSNNTHGCQFKVLCQRSWSNRQVPLLTRMHQQSVHCRNAKHYKELRNLYTLYTPLTVIQDSTMMKMDSSVKLLQPNEETTCFATARGVQIFETNTSRMHFYVQSGMQCTCTAQSISSSSNLYR